MSDGVEQSDRGQTRRRADGVRERGREGVEDELQAEAQTRLAGLLLHPLLCLAFETQINLLARAPSPPHQLPRKPDGRMSSVWRGGGG